ncbi:rhamnogalacturonan II specific xylosyltransferase [Vigna unguiculata]|uniref:Rhamnogalacturonan II specific xylosyltransferase n=1 Tax=Vigna unguiculata TaxID=3917 RepID=A0A4D6MTG8_VIGUN|nr:rhamnogalacturonan II specific xylosyltransferase [Vigna unguiculata]
MRKTMENPLVSLATVSLLFIGFMLIYQCFSYFSNQAILRQKEPLFDQSNLNKSNTEACGDTLECALAKASMGNKTVIIAVVNRAYAEQDVESDTTMLDIFLNSFWLGEGTRSLIHHILIVAVDQIAYDRCQFLKLNCFRLETDGVDFKGEKVYMSQDFVKMMWKRTQFLLEVLKHGYNFIFTDTDVVWLRDPFTMLGKNETEDLQISLDGYLGDPWLQSSPINTGFYFVRSNKKTISLYEKWYAQKDNSTGKKEQDVLSDLIKGGIINQLGLRVRFLDTLYFSSFCQDSKDIRAVITFHAACCRSITAKERDLKVLLSDWKRFKKFQPNNSSQTTKWSTHTWCTQSWGNSLKVKGN